MTPAARERRFRRIREIGCLCCRLRGWFVRPEVHHLNLDGKAGQKRRGDEFTIGLCSYHHQGHLPAHMNRASVRRMLGPCLKESREFRKAFGSDDKLLAEQNRILAECEKQAHPERSRLMESFA